MFEVLKQFYSVHYNVGAFIILLVFTLIYMLSKKNHRGSIIISAIIIALNVFVYKKTVDRVWILTENEKTMRFSVHQDWTITDENGELHHWCWLDEWWDRIASTDLVGTLWGSKQVNSYRKTSEERLNQ
jgi:hypothetical protein